MRRVLAVARLAQGRHGEAASLARGMVEDPEHTVFSRHLLVRTALDTQDKAGALNALTELAEVDLETARRIAVAVALTFPDVDVELPHSLPGRDATGRPTGDVISKQDAGLIGLTVWPNPATGSATVRLSVPEGDAVRLSVHDALGREVAVLARAATASAEHTLDASRLAPGVYLVRAVASGTAVGTAQIVVAR